MWADWRRGKIWLEKLAQNLKFEILFFGRWDEASGAIRAKRANRIQRESEGGWEPTRAKSSHWSEPSQAAYLSPRREILPTLTLDMSELMAPQEGDKEAIQAPIQSNPAAESPKLPMGMSPHPGIGVPNPSQPPPGIPTNQTFDFGMNQTPGVGPPTPNNPSNQGAPANSQSTPSIPTSGSGPGIPDGIPDSLSSGPPVNPMNVPMSGMGPMPTNLGPNQPNPNQSPQQPQKSHLAEILGSHEMAQLKTMSRSTSDYSNNASQNPNPGGMGPGIGPPNPMQPGGQMPNRPTNPGKYPAIKCLSIYGCILSIILNFFYFSYDGWDEPSLSESRYASRFTSSLYEYSPAWDASGHAAKFQEIVKNFQLFSKFLLHNPELFPIFDKAQI